MSEQCSACETRDGGWPANRNANGALIGGFIAVIGTALNAPFIAVLGGWAVVVFCTAQICLTIKEARHEGS